MWHYYRMLCKFNSHSQFDLHVNYSAYAVRTGVGTELQQSCSVSETGLTVFLKPGSISQKCVGLSAMAAIARSCFLLIRFFQSSSPLFLSRASLGGGGQ